MSPLKTGDYCYRCGKGADEPAGEGCKNPAWHIPTALRVAKEREVERRNAEVRLPYAED